MGSQRFSASAGPEAAAYWTGTYLSRWTRRNRLRTLAAAGAAASFLAACVALASPS